jgi:hypothetical protein
MTRPELWKPAMETEWSMLRERGVFKLVEAPPDAHVIDSMWVYTNKYNADGDIIKRKARLVAKGYAQIVFAGPVYRTENTHRTELD